MLNLEKEYYSDKIKLICGTDEAGRGPLCGPVVAAAVILKRDFYSEHINDSKKLTKKKREEAFVEIIKNSVAIGVSYVDAKTIDEINIYEASRLAMTKAIKSLKVKPDLILSDYMPLNIEGIETIPLVKGDAKCECIAAASIVAKVCRDRYMEAIAKKYPEYQFDKNMGYGTKAHLEALRKFGPIPNFHRMSYGPCKFEQLKLF